MNTHCFDSICDCQDTDWHHSIKFGDMPRYVRHFYNAISNGFIYKMEDGPGKIISWIEVEEKDIFQFPELSGVKQVAIHEYDDGSIRFHLVLNLEEII